MSKPLCKFHRVFKVEIKGRSRGSMRNTFAENLFFESLLQFIHTWRALRKGITIDIKEIVSTTKNEI